MSIFIIIIIIIIIIVITEFCSCYYHYCYFLFVIIIFDWLWLFLLLQDIEDASSQEEDPVRLIVDHFDSNPYVPISICGQKDAMCISDRNEIIFWEHN